ncbi:ATP-binding protein [Pseudosporangium ferrugineum]|uniref:histidine kinase n=1 Tax=Pseudosporangium ferrugineum TaxID=439699 RepID=A0A2T0SHQ1_9ACTN|nr:ATP-binding protein [Pseudosporangium ferrugineum]PRY32940.1 signal transduction histidine kinase [Pseudosporangium ferrugineum]
MGMRRRVNAGFLILVTLFVAVVVTQIVVDDRLRVQHAARTERLERARDANIAVLQHLTDAETGVRGFQLTGRRAFLDPYDQGRVRALAAFDEAEANTADPGVRDLLAQERSAAREWLTAYATPVLAGGADPGTARGKELFDRLRGANAAVDDAIGAQQEAYAATARRQAGLAQAAFAGLGAVLLGVAIALGAWGRRFLLAPLEHIRVTLDRLAGGDLSARAVPSGPAEMRAVIGTLNRLAAETERLLAADRARLVRTELRQAAGVELRAGPAGIHRVVRLLGEALGAEAVHGRVCTEPGTTLGGSWPEDAAPLPPAVVAEILGGEPGTVLALTGTAGALAVPLGGDADCPPGLLCVLPRDGREWTGDDRRLLATVAREIEHSVGQHRLRHRQERLITEMRVLDERKDAFVATVTHELRTPLTSILGYTEMLTEGDGGDLTAIQRRGLTAIQRNAHRLQDTIADLMVLDGTHRPGAGQGPVDLATLARSVQAEVAPEAGARGVGLTGELHPAEVVGDARRLERVLRNLLDNAVKFTGTGGHVTCRVHADDDAAVVAVSDTGIGIPEADLPGLFTPFHRGANAMDRAVQGTGLGLAIVRTIVTEHGGTVGVESKLDRGTTFTVRLPLRA